MNTVFIDHGAMGRAMAGTTSLSVVKQTLGDYQRLPGRGDEGISALYLCQHNLFVGNG